MSSTQFDRRYVYERAIWVALFSTLFLAFATQIYVRTRGSTSLSTSVFDATNAKAVNQLCGAVSSLMAAIAWLDIHQVRYIRGQDFGVGCKTSHDRKHFYK